MAVLQRNYIQRLAAITFFTLFFLLSSNVLFSQGLPIKILDGHTKSPLIGANVVNEDGSYFIVTDMDGSARIRGVPLDEFLTITYIGFRDRRMTLKEIIDNEGVILMQEIAIGLGSVDIVVSSKAAERQGDIANKVIVIDAKKIELLNPQNSADLLQASGVFVQRSQMGGGSPIIRGFEANKLLIVVDGVRLNNAIYRNGHLQNVITIDNSMLERTEIIQGPSSVIYGSDALGGVMHFISKDPRLALQKGGKEVFDGSAYARYSSANNERAAHLDFNYGTEKLALLSSLTYSDFSDLRVGARGMKDYPGFGRKNFYVNSILQPDGSYVDSVLTNPDPLKQLFTGYTQFDALQKIKYQYNDELSFLVNFQYSTTSNVPRFDQLNVYSIDTIDLDAQQFDSIPKFSRWDYGPQNRMFVSFKARYIPKVNKLFDEMDLIVSYQRLDEDRIKRRFGKNITEHQEEDVYVAAFNGDLVKIFNAGKTQKLLYGTEIVYNNVGSNAFNENIQTGVIDSRFALSRYPNGGSKMLSGSLYANYRHAFSDRFTFMAGSRYTYTWLSSQFRTDSLVLALPFSEITINNGGLTGSLSASYNFAKGWHLDAVAATAFRSPNVDDYGKVRSNGGYVTFPNDSLSSEKSLNFEVSLTKAIDKKFLISGTYFYTYLFDAIVRDNFSFNGQSTYFIDGGYDTIQANVNAGRAFINGVSSSFQWNPLPNIQLKSTFNWVTGYNVTANEPLAHIPPAYGQTSASWETNKFELTFLSRYNGWKRLESYAPGGSDNLEDATVDGTPPWITYNLYFKWNLSPKITLNVACENIADTHYRVFSSGVSAPGRNIIVTLRSTF
ncbi:MAG: TonB-dependent receptor [Saprospiraceae bacterium]